MKLNFKKIKIKRFYKKLVETNTSIKPSEIHKILLRLFFFHCVWTGSQFISPKSLKFILDLSANFKPNFINLTGSLHCRAVYVKRH